MASGDAHSFQNANRRHRQSKKLRRRVGAILRGRYSAALPLIHGVIMAKKKSKIKAVVETVEGWVGMGPKAKKKKTAKKAAAPKKTKKKGKKKAATKKKKKK
jgi:hypothetical protein